MTLQVGNKDLWVFGRFPKIIKLEAEYVEWVDDPSRFVAEIKAKGISADIFTFVQKGIADTTPKFEFHCEWDRLAVLSITTFEDWWKNQIKSQERNRIRKAQKSNVEVRLVEFNSELMKEIKALYDESPIRQGQPLAYHKKPIEHLWKAHQSFLDRSQYIGAFYAGQLIGFAKVVHDEGISNIIKLICRIGHRDKAPSNALLAKAVEICAEKGVRYLGYSTWCRRGLGEFKRNHAFVPVAVPRYFVPLNLRGELALRLKMHRKFSELLPPSWVDVAAECRARFNMWRFSAKQ